MFAQIFRARKGARGVWLSTEAVYVVQLHRTKMCRCCNGGKKCSAQFYDLQLSTGVVPVEEPNVVLQVMTWLTVCTM